MREPRTRITLFLPAPVTLPQHFLVDEVLTALIEVCGGVTASQQFPAVFSGWWCQQDFDQDVVWITVHHVDRIAAYDYAR